MRRQKLKLKNCILLIPLLLIACLDVSPTLSQHDKEVKAIDNYLSSATFQRVIQNNNSGIRIGITQFGTGAPPHDSQIIQATFVGHLLSDWSIFENISFNGIPEDISSIGLKYGVESLLEGSTATIFIPSDYAFGSLATSAVPANATVAYEVILSKVTKTSTELTQFKADTTAIRKYLTDSSIAATAHPSGIWYAITSAGSGNSPDAYDYVTFHYKGSILSSGAVFQEGDVTQQMVFGLIDGLKIGLPLLKTGDAAVFYIPSGLGYGPSGSTGIAKNANLIFEIKLTSIP